MLHNKIIEIKKNIDEGNEYRLSADNIYKTYFEDLNSFTDSIQRYLISMKSMNTRPVYLHIYIKYSETI